MKETTLCITVSDDLQSIILPPYGVTFGVSGDVNVNEIRMKLPKECKGFDLIGFVPRINYVNPNGDTNYYESTMESDESNCYLTWPVTPDITAYTGHVRFSLTLYQTEEGIILHKFNTRSATGHVYTGFEAEKQVTPEQQLTLLSKLETQIKADLNDHTERLKNELTEKGKEILDGFGESGSAVEELKNIKQDLSTKLTAPPTPEVGKILKIKSVNEDGTFVCEWADDGGSNLDVRIDGKSIIQDGVAEIPVANGVKYGSSYGLVHFVAGYCYGIETGRIKIPNYEATDGIKLVIPSTAGMNGRYNPGTNGFGAITTNTFDNAVKAAMCDGKGAAWTADEQAAARERMGALDTQDMIDITEITMDAKTLKYVFPSFADYRILEISFSKTKKEIAGLTGNILLKPNYAHAQWVVTSTFADMFNIFTLDTSGKSCIGKNMHTNNTQIAIGTQGLIVDKEYWNAEFRGSPYLLLPNTEWAQYCAECNTIIKVRGIKR